MYTLAEDDEQISSDESHLAQRPSGWIWFRALCSFFGGLGLGLVGVCVGEVLRNSDWKREGVEEAPRGESKFSLTSLDVLVAEDADPAPPACHDISLHEVGPCVEAIRLAQTKVRLQHLAGVKGLVNASSLHEWQVLMSHNPPWGRCPIPCDYVKNALCSGFGGMTPKMWSPDTTGGQVDIKVLSYNLYWWHLFELDKGLNNIAGKLIKSTGPYDVIGLQECKDYRLVLEPVGLLEEYEAFEGWREICVAYRRKVWTLLDNGTRQVSVDQPTEWYGTRGTQWVRLQHKVTGQYLFFANHHGPLSVNSGGQCGGVSTAQNILKLVGEKAHVGDAVVIVGDFNANAQSLTIQELWKNLVLLYNGKSFGGVDNIFGNMPLSSVVQAEEILHGGSDHDPISVTLRLGSRARVNFRPYAFNGPLKAKLDSNKSECGILENDIEYLFKGAHSLAISNIAPRACCSYCKKAHCKAWTYLSWDPVVRASRCALYNVESAGWRVRLGAVSGLPPNEAAFRAEIAMSEAISEISDTIL